MLKVYIAGKLNDSAVGYIKNINSMIYWACKIHRLGFAVFVPCIDFMLGVAAGDWEYQDYFDNSQPFLEVCDLIFVCPNYETSKGTLAEIKRAKELNIPIYYKLEDLSSTLNQEERK